MFSNKVVIVINGGSLVIGPMNEKRAHKILELNSFIKKGHHYFETTAHEGLEPKIAQICPLKKASDLTEAILREIKEPIKMT